MGNFGRGQPIRRVEDQRFLTGTGRYTDDISIAGQAYLYVLRSTHAHADITAKDIAAAKVGPIPVEMVPARADGTVPPPPHRPLLAETRVRYVGEPVAAVIAESLAAAKDAAELIEVDYHDLPAVTL